MLVLQQIEKVEAHWVHEVFGIVRFLPVLQILQVVDERLVLKEPTLGEDCGIDTSLSYTIKLSLVF